jgi:predicted O-methyltransferase YrrM
VHEDAYPLERRFLGVLEDAAQEVRSLAPFVALQAKQQRRLVRGRLITTEFEPSKVTRAKANLTEGGLIDLVEVREGDALETLSADLPDRIDLLLLDGAKALYPEILNLVEGRLRPGALVIADNADLSPDYLRQVRSPAGGYMSMPFGDDVELSMRLA